MGSRLLIKIVPKSHATVSRCTNLELSGIKRAELAGLLDGDRSSKVEGICLKRSGVFLTTKTLIHGCPEHSLWGAVFRAGNQPHPYRVPLNLAQYGEEVVVLIPAIFMVRVQRSLHIDADRR